MMTVMAKHDNLVPNESTIPLINAVSSTDKEMVAFPTGHIGLFVGSKSHTEGWPKVMDWIAARSSIEEKKQAEPGLKGTDQGIIHHNVDRTFKKASRSRRTTGPGKGAGIRSNKGKKKGIQ